jgi:dihydroorotate dehydrogenase
MVYEIARSVQIPVIGVGGVRSADDVLEFVCAGASAVQVGTAMFTDPALMVHIVDDLRAHLTAAGTTIAELRGRLHRPPPAAQPAAAAGRGGHA